MGFNLGFKGLRSGVDWRIVSAHSGVIHGLDVFEMWSVRCSVVLHGTGLVLVYTDVSDQHIGYISKGQTNVGRVT